MADSQNSQLRRGKNISSAGYTFSRRWYCHPLPNTGNQDLKLSDACVKQLQKVSKSGDALRVTVDGGGCSGFQYLFELNSETSEDDRVFERDGVRVITDSESLEYLKGSTIDFHEELIRSAFRVVDNPLAEQGCSCGASFNVKL